MSTAATTPAPESRAFVDLAYQLPGAARFRVNIMQQQGSIGAVLRAIPVLAVTAYAGKGDEERIRDAGAEGYLAKPVSIGPFMAAVKGLVERAAA